MPDDTLQRVQQTLKEIIGCQPPKKKVRCIWRTFRRAKVGQPSTGVLPATLRRRLGKRQHAQEHRHQTEGPFRQSRDPDRTVRFGKALPKVTVLAFATNDRRDSCRAEHWRETNERTWRNALRWTLGRFAQQCPTA